MKLAKNHALFALPIYLVLTGFAETDEHVLDLQRCYQAAVSIDDTDMTDKALRGIADYAEKSGYVAPPGDGLFKDVDELQAQLHPNGDATAESTTQALARIWLDSPTCIALR